MPSTCSVCAHPDREAVDRAVSSGVSIRDTAGRHGLSRSAVHRHAAGCLRLGAPAGRLRAAIDRDALAEVVADTLDRAREALDDAEARPDRRARREALVTVLRACDTAARVLPPAEAVTHPETAALLRTLAYADLDPGARAAITTGLREQGADDLADAVAQVWARRPALLATTTRGLTDDHLALPSDTGAAGRTRPAPPLV